MKLELRRKPGGGWLMLVLVLVALARRSGWGIKHSLGYFFIPPSHAETQTQIESYIRVLSLPLVLLHQ